MSLLSISLLVVERIISNFFEKAFKTFSNIISVNLFFLWTNLTALFRKYVDIIPTQYKFIQYSLDNSEIKYIREKPLSVSELKKIKDAYELYVGKINIKFSKVENIPYDKSGKYRYFESKIKT